MGAMRLTSHWRSIHDLILGYRVVLMIHVGAGACCFPLDDVYLHVLDFDSHQQEVYLPHNDVFQVVSGEEKVKKTRCTASNALHIYRPLWSQDMESQSTLAHIPTHTAIAA